MNMIALNKNFLFKSPSSSTRQCTSIILPSSQKRIFYPNPEKANIKITGIGSNTETNGPRYNEIGIQMLSKKIYDQIFIEGNTVKCKSTNIIEQCKKDLAKHNMLNKKENLIEDVDFKIPPLKGKNIEEHFKIIGEEQAEPYRELILKLIEGIPQRPTNWLMQVGWTRYEHGMEPQQVLFPQEEIMVFDIEESIY